MRASLVSVPDTVNAMYLRLPRSDLTVIVPSTNPIHITLGGSRGVLRAALAADWVGYHDLPSAFLTSERAVRAGDGDAAVVAMALGCPAQAYRTAQDLGEVPSHVLQIVITFGAVMKGHTLDMVPSAARASSHFFRTQTTVADAAECVVVALFWVVNRYQKFPGGPLLLENADVEIAHVQVDYDGYGRNHYHQKSQAV